MLNIKIVSGYPVKISFAGPVMEYMGKNFGEFLRSNAYGLSTTN